MNTLESKPDVLQPEVFRKEKGISAWFTLKNENTYSGNRNIPGLNLGLNTEEKEEVVRENRSVLFDELDVEPEWMALANQVHGNRVQVVTRGGTYTETDGFVTQIPRLALAIQVADCAAVLLGDAHNRIVGAAHAGWRGVTGGIVPKVVKYMTAQGADPMKMRAFVSPCISAENFEVGPEVAEQFPDQFVDYSSYEKPHVNLKGFIRYQLMEKGVKPEHIEVHEGCTVSDGHSFYSYRREGKQSGRMMGIIQLLKRDEL